MIENMRSGHGLWNKGDLWSIYGLCIGNCGVQVLSLYLSSWSGHEFYYRNRLSWHESRVWEQWSLWFGHRISIIVCRSAMDSVLQYVVHGAWTQYWNLVCRAWTQNWNLVCRAWTQCWNLWSAGYSVLEFVVWTRTQYRRLRSWHGLGVCDLSRESIIIGICGMQGMHSIGVCGTVMESV